MSVVRYFGKREAQKAMAESKKPSDPAVYCLSKPSRCYSCDARQEAGEIVKLIDGQDEREVQCKKCAGLSEFKMVRAGDAKITRMAKKHSPQRFVVLKWSELWKTYERQGLLVQPEAVELIEKELGVKL
jgi:hypothetical protein